MRILLITYDLQAPWDNGLKVYGRGLMNSLRNIDGTDVSTVHSIKDISNNHDGNYDYVHIVLTGIRPFVKALKTFKHAKIFKHIVTPSMGLRNAVATKCCYGIVNGLENRLVRCFSSKFVAGSYFMEGNLIVPPSIDTSFFTDGIQSQENKIMTLLKGSTIKSGIDNLKDHSNGLLLYSGPLTEDRFPYKKVLNALKDSKLKLIIIGRPTNNGAEIEKVKEIVAYSKKLNIENRMAIALRILNEEEKINLLTLSDVIIQPFSSAARLYVAVDPPIFPLEAMACGKPVITSKSYSFQSFIKNGYNGYTIDWDDPEEVDRALVECQNTNLGTNARDTILRDFSCDSVSQKLKMMYNDYN